VLVCLIHMPCFYHVPSSDPQRTNHGAEQLPAPALDPALYLWRLLASRLRNLSRKKKANTPAEHEILIVLDFLLEKPMECMNSEVMSGAQ